MKLKNYTEFINEASMPIALNDKDKQAIIYDLVYMIKQIPSYGGSAETEWAYKDFRKDLYKIIKMAAKRNWTLMSDDFAMEIGTAILQAMDDTKQPLLEFEDEN